MGYPGFDPMGLSKGNFSELKEKEIKNGRLAMVAFVGFVFAAQVSARGVLGISAPAPRLCEAPPSSPRPLQTTGKGPIAALSEHLANPAASNWTQNIGKCVTPATADVDGVVLHLSCLWPAGH